MPGCVALVTDLIFATRIGGTAGQAGLECRIVRSVGDLEAAVRAHRPALVLLDLQADGIVGPDAVARTREADPDTRVVGFVSHVEKDLAAAAAAAGAEVLPRSRFVHQLPELLAAAAEGRTG